MVQFFLDDTSKTNDSVKIKDAVAEYLRKKKFAKVVGICISQKSYEWVWKILDSKNMKEIMRLKQDQYFIDAYEMLCKKRKLTQKDKEYILGAAVFTF